MLYHLLNKPWQWRSVLAEYRQRREAQWELVEFWRDLRERTCRACVRERSDLDAQHICRACWRLAKSSRPLSVSEQIRVNRLLHLELV